MSMPHAAKPGTLRLVLGDQLSEQLSALDELNPSIDVVLMAEVLAEAVYVRHHKQKIALTFASMRHFAERLRKRGIQVRYVGIDDGGNLHSITGELARALDETGLGAITVTECGEWRLAEQIADYARACPVPLQIRPDRRFICSKTRFAHWANGKKQLRMEFFYREMRREHQLLMDGDQPAGGQWNYDHENRKRLPSGFPLPERLRFLPDPITVQAIDDVARLFPDHFGELESFGWPTHADAAEQLLEDFISNILPGFGDWQDAMSRDQPWMWHALISTSLNLGLIDPMDACRRAEAAYRAGLAPLNAVEGFVRQVLGWREFVRGIYWLKVPEYRSRNHLDADRQLPELFWSTRSAMACVSDVVKSASAHAYAHHIQRLMITGNLAMLLGVHPDQVDEWYMVVFADAYEWVEMPNTRGMATFADGGIVGSKPYAASGAYIDRMGNYCSGCSFDVKAKSGSGACPFNRLYWGFLERNRKRLAGNPRMGMAYRTLDGFGPDRRKTLLEDADACRMELGALPLI